MYIDIGMPEQMHIFGLICQNKIKLTLFDSFLRLALTFRISSVQMLDIFCQ